MFGFELNENSISVPTWSIYFTIVFGSGLFLKLILGGFLRRRKEKQEIIAVEERKLRKQESYRLDALAEKNREEQETRQREEEEEQQKMNIKKLFPYPWLHAYSECEGCQNWEMRLVWLRSWLKNYDSRTLPKLSTEAIETFAELILPKEVGPIYEEALHLLSPYIQFSYDTETPGNRIHMMAEQKKAERDAKKCNMPSGFYEKSTRYQQYNISMGCSTIEASHFCAVLSSMSYDDQITDFQFRRFVRKNLPNVKGEKQC